MPQDVQTAESSTATPVVESPKIEQFTDDQREAYFSEGKLPEPPKVEESAPSQDPPEAEEAKPASESGTEKPQQEPKKGKGIEKRNAELSEEINTLRNQLAERKRLRAELAEVGNGAQPTAPPAATQPAPANTGEPKEPDENDFDDLMAYQRAIKQYAKDLAVYHRTQSKSEILEAVKADLRAEEQKKAAEEANQEISKRFWSKANEIARNTPDFADTIFDQSGNFRVQLQPLADQALTASAFGPEILYQLSKNPEEVQRINSLFPHDAVREIVKLEFSLSGNQSASTPPVTPAKTATPKLPSPPTELGGRNSAPADEIAAALAAGDMARYIELSNAKELAKRRK